MRSATTASGTTPRPSPSPVRLFLAARPARSTLAAAVIIGVLTAWLGTSLAPVPTAVDAGQATVPVWRLLALGAAVLPVLALHSQLADLEVVATRRLRRLQRGYLAGMGSTCALIYLGLSATTLPVTALAVAARAWIAWFGLALLSGAVLGWRLAWVLPAIAAVIVIYWGYMGDGYAWWEFSARPHDDLLSLILSVGLLAVGVAAYSATPWRRRRWSPSRSQRRGLLPPGRGRSLTGFDRVR